MRLIIDIPERDYDLACKYPNALIATYAHYIKNGKPYEERPQGKWVEGYYQGFETLDCSICGYVRNERYSNYNFCPNCGADMRGCRE